MVAEKAQLVLFAAEEVLPLFTGTAMVGEVEVFVPQPAARQLGLGCPICHDTGEVHVDGRLTRCICQLTREVGDDDATCG